MDEINIIKEKKTLPLLDIQKTIMLGKEWFLKSGIQKKKEGDHHFGAVSSWYDSEKKKYAYAYPEITGYAITFHMYLNSLNKDERYIKNAKAAAQWIIREPLDPELMEIQFRLPYEPYLSSPAHSYTFDNAMIITGLVHLFKATGESCWLDHAVALAERMIKFMQNKEGFFHAYFDMSSGKILESKEKWSQQPGVHHAKLAIPLLLLFKITGDVFYKDSALKVCEWILNRQESNGRFVTNPSDGSTTLHPHCYALEGLFFADDHEGNPRFKSAILKGLRWLIESQLQTGGFPSEFKDKIFLRTERADALAQTIRLLCLAINRGIVDEELTLPLLCMVRRIVSFQQKEGPSPEKGGFRFFSDERGNILPHLNAWVTIFSLQALQFFVNLSQDNSIINMHFLC